MLFVTWRIRKKKILCYIWFGLLRTWILYILTAMSQHHSFVEDKKKTTKPFYLTLPSDLWWSKSELSLTTLNNDIKIGKITASIHKKNTLMLFCPYSQRHTHTAAKSGTWNWRNSNHAAVHRAIIHEKISSHSKVIQCRYRICYITVHIYTPDFLFM